MRYYTEVPNRLSRTLAAALAGVSPRTFRRRYLDAGLLRLEQDTLWHDGTDHRGYIPRYALEAALGHDIGLSEVVEAEKKLAPKRVKDRVAARRRTAIRERRNVYHRKEIA